MSKIMDQDIHILKSLVAMFWLLLITLPYSHSQPPQLSPSPDCKKPYKCGHLSVSSYPFWGQSRGPECGASQLFHLKCDHNDTSIQIGSTSFTVKDINVTTNTMRLVPTEQDHACSHQFLESYVTLFPYPPPHLVYNITVFTACYPVPYSPFIYNFTCDGTLQYFAMEDEALFKKFQLFEHCKEHWNVTYEYLELYISQSGGGVGDWKEIQKNGLEVKYDDVPQDCKTCGLSDGRCWSDGSDEHVLCYYCPAHDAPALPCPSKTKTNTINFSWKIILGVGSPVMTGFMIFLIICCRKCISSSGQVKLWFMIINDHDIEAFLKNHGALAQRRYKFSEVKKMTNSFRVKLGQGGFGSVYKGELPTGSTVAVKILNASKGNGEDFINEVASISRTSHVNVVTLLGFCLEGHKKALIYEFMPNGSLDKFISNKGLKKTTESLSWDNLWQISLGIARGLEYLHRGCNTRILHFDIKPHNILLGEDFCPKISDFGLAKLCPRKESIISMSDARGTIGYVAPEMWNRNFGGISHKSDVYSYGMMLLEMVGVTENINANSSHTSEIYFPDWIYKMLEQGEDLRTDGEIGTKEKEIASRMTVVGLWCVQTFPKDRPAMSRVIDMLEGNMNSLELPPKPVLSSPTRSLPEFSTISL